MTERPADPATSQARPAAPGFFASGAWAAAGGVACAVLGPLLAPFRPRAERHRRGHLPRRRPVGAHRRGDGHPRDATLAAVCPRVGRHRHRCRRSGAAASATWIAARSAPPIHDVTTDLDNPPRYVAVAKLRVPPANSVDYGGEAVARQQRASYGDLRPLIVHAPPPRVLAMAADTARAEGWTVLAQDIGFGDLGRLEATDTSFLFGRHRRHRRAHRAAPGRQPRRRALQRPRRRRRRRPQRQAHPALSRVSRRACGGRAGRRPGTVMTTRTPFRCLLLAVAVIAAGVPAAAQAPARPASAAPRPMTAVDLIDVPRLSDPQLSPDGTQIVFLRSDADWHANKRITHVWRAVVATGETTQLTAGVEGETSPRWSPDGRTIAFIAKRSGDDVAQIYVLPVAGGEATRLTAHDAAPTALAWMPDGTGAPLRRARSQDGRREGAREGQGRRLRLRRGLQAGAPLARRAAVLDAAVRRRGQPSAGRAGQPPHRRRLLRRRVRDRARRPPHRPPAPAEPAVRLERSR